MKIRALLPLMLGGFFLSTAAFAGDYNPVPAGDPYYAACLSYSATIYQGGSAASPVAGQSKAQAWCTCMWNETPDDFRGSLAKFSETAKGAAMNKTCEKHANWE